MMMKMLRKAGLCVSMVLMVCLMVGCSNDGKIKSYTEEQGYRKYYQYSQLGHL